MVRERAQDKAKPVTDAREEKRIRYLMVGQLPFWHRLLVITFLQAKITQCLEPEIII